MDEKVYLEPPRQYIRFPYHHWIQPTDFEGRAMLGPVVMQWQPAAKSWCHSGNIATGVNIHLDATVNRYLGPCAEYDLETDLTVLQDKDLRFTATTLLKNIRENGSRVVSLGDENFHLAVDEKEYKLILELVKMYANPI